MQRTINVWFPFLDTFRIFNLNYSMVNKPVRFQGGQASQLHMLSKRNILFVYFFLKKIGVCPYYLPIIYYYLPLAEGVGFEPTDTCISPVFKTGAFGHSATPP